MSAVRQCDSCHSIGLPWTLGEVDLPAGWGKIAIDLPGSIGWGDNKVTKIYELCPECIRKPITFAGIQLQAGKQ